ncbi:MAG: SDR family oxidoreductase [Sciscionella sp.]
MSQRRVALITGASRGIGAATARALGETHRVLLGGRDAAALDALAGELPDATAWPVDLTDPSAVARAVSGLGSLDVLVHSAGLCRIATVEHTSAQDWRDTLAVNLFAVVELTRLLLPALRTAAGHVVLINSGQGKAAAPGWSAYAASKFALRAFADSLRAEETTLRVSSVYPGRTATEMQRALRASEGAAYEPERYLAPESVAAAVRGAVLAGPDAEQTEIVLRPARR